jgi:hypothetical protein
MLGFGYADRYGLFAISASGELILSTCTPPFALGLRGLDEQDGLRLYVG